MENNMVKFTKYTPNDAMGLNLMSGLGLMLTGEPTHFFISKFNRYLEFRLANTPRQDVVTKITTDELDLLDLLRLFDSYGEQYVNKFELQMGQYINSFKSGINKTAVKIYLAELVEKCMGGKSI